MARNFDATNTHQILKGSAIVTATPITVAAWINPNSVAAVISILSIGNNASGDAFIMQTQLSPVGITCVVHQGAATNTAAKSTLVPVAGTWYHACCVFVSATAFTAYTNGGNKTAVTGQTSIIPAGVNNAGIGRNVYTPSTTEANCIIAFPAVWNIVLSDADVLELSLGLSPKFKHPESLVSYPWLASGASPEQDLVSSLTWAVTGTPAVVANPGIWPP